MKTAQPEGAALPLEKQDTGKLWDGMHCLKQVIPPQQPGQIPQASKGGNACIYPAKPIGGMSERDSGVTGRLIIALGIADK